jgi:hypothetical protein
MTHPTISILFGLIRTTLYGLSGKNFFWKSKELKGKCGVSLRVSLVPLSRLRIKIPTSRIS